jgi:hypothetical protein
MRKIQKLLVKCVLVIFFAAFLFSVTPISIADYTAGVKVGDWVKFGEISLTWTGTGTEPSYIKDEKNLDWMKMEVKSVSGTQVVVETTGKYKNGTSTQSSSSTLDVATGEGLSGGFGMLIGANLSEGDTIPQQYGSQMKINGTATRTYCNAMRSVNYVDLSASYSGQTQQVKAYWDKATGILVEAYMHTSVSTPTAQTIELSLKATETNMWSADIAGTLESNPIYIVAIIVVVLIVIIVLIIARRRKPVSTATPAPQPSTPAEPAAPEKTQ